MEDGISTARIDPDSAERFQRLRADLGVTSFGLNLIVLDPGQRGRIHRHERQEEVYLVLEGTLTLGLDGEERAFGAGELVRVAPDLRRQLVNRHRARLVLVALGGYGEHEGRDGMAYESWESNEARRPQETALPEDLRESELSG
ncbi:MAG: cupin domain-containing protein [Thermoleophilaceae bacterium]